MKLFLPAVVLLAASIAVPARAGDVKLTVSNGRITLQARDATVREILSEWARVGQIKIVNAERIMGTPVNLELQDVPEGQALNILLRSVSGYMAAPKPAPAQTASMYDRIVIMATPRTALLNVGSTATPQPPQLPQYRGLPNGMPNPTMLDDQDDPAAAPPTYPGVAPGFAGPARGAGPQPQQPYAAPGLAVPGTIPQGAPGTISPMPTQPMMPGQQPPAAQPGTGPAGTVTTPPPPKKPGGPGEPGGEI